MIISNKAAKKISLFFFSNIRLLCLVCLFGIIQGVSVSVSAAQQNVLQGVRTWPSPDNSRVVLDLSAYPKYETHYLTNPDRLVIDLMGTTNKADLKANVHKGTLINNVRQSPTKPSTTFRLVIDLQRPSKAKIFRLPPAKPYGHRLVIDLPNLATKVPTRIAAVGSGRNIIIAIDAGHGGDDPGALGKYTYEKKVTLEMAKRLKTKIDAQRGMQAFLVRSGDYFVNLNKRSDIARKGKADFLVSIHADGFTSSQPRGASVWVLSNRRATTELGRWMEKHEAHSELLGGAGDIIQDSDSVPFLNKMLLDMSMGNTMGVGFTIGSLVTKELSRVTYMHKKQPVHASLAVLKSPDIPSILVEAGFITNPTEERLLNQADFQNKIATAVYKGIYKHFSEKPPQGTLFAQKKTAIKHTVRSGESLSTLARRYSVTSQKLKSFNHLKSNTLKVGQVLSIPENYRVVKEAQPEPRVVSRPTQSTSDQKASVHVVARGESLSLIAQRYNQTTAQLKSYNNLRSTTLAVGQKINIPGNASDNLVQTPSVAATMVTPAPQVATKTVEVHKVASGESLSLIADKYKKSIQELSDYNNLKSTSIFVGQSIKIPGNASNNLVSTPSVAASIVAPTPKMVTKTVEVHKVTSGESLSLLADKYNKSIQELSDYNNLKSTSLLVGQNINIPGNVAVVEPVVQKVQAASQSTTQPSSESTQLHTVKSGESLSVIAQTYDTNISQLKSQNDLKSSVLFVGQKIEVPSTESSASSQQTEQVYTVKSGDALSVIADQFGVTMATLTSYNQLKSTSVYVGQTIKIPAGGAVSQSAPAAVVKVAQPTEHKVVSGESLSVIAESYGKSAEEFEAYNHLSSSTLLVGQVLKIPEENYQVPVIPTSHTVTSGQSLSVIAQQYGTTTQQLIALNELRSSSLTVGQILKLPTKKVEQMEHKVRSGESLSVIAQRYGTTTKAIVLSNKLNSKSLAVGQVLTIPIS